MSLDDDTVVGERPPAVPFLCSRCDQLHDPERGFPCPCRTTPDPKVPRCCCGGPDCATRPSEPRRHPRDAGGIGTARRILISGSRDWTDRPEMFRVLGRVIFGGRPSDCVVVHGGARGADTLAGDIAASWNVPVEVHQADWHAHGASAGPRRNQAMVDLGADVLLAFPAGQSRGTRDCIRRAQKAGIPVIVTWGPAG